MCPEGRSQCQDPLIKRPEWSQGLLSLRSLLKLISYQLSDDVQTRPPLSGPQDWLSLSEAAWESEGCIKSEETAWICLEETSKELTTQISPGPDGVMGRGSNNKNRAKASVILIGSNGFTEQIKESGRVSGQ